MRWNAAQSSEGPEESLRLGLCWRACQNAGASYPRARPDPKSGIPETSDGTEQSLIGRFGREPVQSVSCRSINQQSHIVSSSQRRSSDSVKIDKSIYAIA